MRLTTILTLAIATLGQLAHATELSWVERVKKERPSYVALYSVGEDHFMLFVANAGYFPMDWLFESHSGGIELLGDDAACGYGFCKMFFNSAGETIDPNRFINWSEKGFEDRVEFIAPDGEEGLKARSVEFRGRTGRAVFERLTHVHQSNDYERTGKHISCRKQNGDHQCQLILTTSGLEDLIRR